jgi:AraC-like DNA-binding protein
MALVGTTIFTDPEDYKTDFRGTKIDLVFMGGGDFTARMTSIDLTNLHLVHSQEGLPRIAHVSLPPKRVFMSFATRFDPPPIYDGIELQSGDLIFHSIGECMHQRTNGACAWMLVSLTPTYLAKFSKVITGVDLVPPSASRIMRPPTNTATHLRRLLTSACRVAETQADVIARRECLRSLEQELFHALVTCLITDDALDHAATRRHHAIIVGRFENVLAAHPDRQLRMDELCTAVGVPERALRICCAEMLGMGPNEYIRLRRLNMVRAALRRPDAAGISIAQIAARYGFAEPGRFAVAYRSVFGESPSATRHRLAARM